MSDVADLKVTLTADTASFSGPLNKADQDAKNAASNIQGSINGIDTSEARGAVKLLGEEIGIHLPRHVSNLIAELPGVAQAMAIAFPALAVLVLGKAVLDLVEKTKQHTEQLEKEAGDAVTSAQAMDSRATALKITNLQLEDSIRIMNKEIPRNTVVIAAEQAKAALQKLEEEFDVVIQKEAKLFEEETVKNWAQIFMESFDDTSVARKIEDSARTVNVYLTEMASYDRQYWLAKKEKRDTDSASFKAKLDRDRGELESFLHDASKEFTGSDKDSERYQTKISALLLTLEREQDLEQETVQHNNDMRKEAGLKQTADIVSNLNERYATEKQVLDQLTKANIAYYELEFKEGKITAEQLNSYKQAALDKQYAAEMAHFEKLKTLEAGHTELVKRIQSQEEALTQAYYAKIIEGASKTLDEQKRLLEGMAKFQEELNKKQEEDATKAAKRAMDAAAKKNKEILSDIELIQGAGEKRIAQIDQEIQHLNQLIDKYHLQGSAATQVYAAIHQLEIQRQQDIIKEELASGKLGQVFHGTMQQMILDGQQWQLKVANTFKQSIDQMNSQLASFVTTGKFNWQQLASGAIESIVKIALQYLESHMLMLITKGSWNAQSAALDAQQQAQTITKNVSEATSSASTAAANTLADVPFPFNIPAATMVQGVGMGFAAAATAEGGGILPDREMMVHTHPEEMILPQHISNFVMNAAAGASGSGGGGTHNNVHYNPIIQGNADEEKLNAHFDKRLKSWMRKKGQRLN